MLDKWEKDSWMWRNYRQIQQKESNQSSEGQKRFIRLEESDQRQRKDETQDHLLEHTEGSVLNQLFFNWDRVNLLIEWS